ncbi:peptide deformylase [Longispora albida]|uniref:peptide deformylase n=1 Tax=Longispora albida TaxID=203523 RepID=UPI00058DD203|nr:peptide deformylase [Longispora albida]
MTDLGIVQIGAPELVVPARPLRLPREAALALDIEAELVAAAGEVQALHDFANGMGIAATQIGYGYAACVVRSREGEYLTFFNPRVVDASVDCDEQYEGCLSFFDVRGLVPRPVRITVVHTGLDGEELKTECGPGLARLVAHELDHLEGRLYLSHLRTPVMGIEEYQKIRRPWS